VGSKDFQSCIYRDRRADGRGKKRKRFLKRTARKNGAKIAERRKRMNKQAGSRSQNHLKRNDGSREGRGVPKETFLAGSLSARSRGAEELRLGGRKKKGRTREELAEKGTNARYVHHRKKIRDLF